jgi:succinylglutamate desuccinylase
MKRLIGEYTQGLPGPLMIIFGGIHGNEWAGVEALKTAFYLLRQEPLKNPNFKFHGAVIGLAGNLEALKTRTRFIDHDLNRIFPDLNSQWHQLDFPEVQRSSEARELTDLLLHIQKFIDHYKPERLLILDIHTTSAFGGTFTVTTDDDESLNAAPLLHAPVIKNFIGDLKGTLLQYFKSANLAKKTIALSFEAGQHEDPVSVDRAVAAIINGMKAGELVSSDDVENHHDQILRQFSSSIPAILTLKYVHDIKKVDNFVMLPGFRNFQSVNEGQLLAYEGEKPILSPLNGRILMPLYQVQGNEGFFIVS